MAKKTNLKIYIENLIAGVNEEEIIKAAIESGIVEEDAKENLAKAKVVLEKNIKKKAERGENEVTSQERLDNMSEVDEKTLEVISKMEELKVLIDEVRKLRRENKLSDVGFANLGREMTQHIKFTKRYTC